MSNLKKHFIYKLLTNIVRIPILFVLQAIFPRLLGPLAYGNFDFLTDTANKITNFFDGGVSIGFYTKLSQNKSNKHLVKYYTLLVCTISLIYILFVLITHFYHLFQFIWPGQLYSYIFLSSILGVITFYSNGLLKMIDAYELTKQGEWAKVSQLFLSLVIFLVIFLIFNNISLQFFYLLQILLISFLVFSNIYILKKANFSHLPNVILTKNEILFYSKEFWRYSSPLISAGVISLIAGIGERWILQLYGGSLQQGYFALSYKISTFVFLFTGAMMPLLMREVSKNFALNDTNRIRTLFSKNIKILYFLVTFMAVFVALNSKFITKILGGKNFEGAGFVVSLMAFYPIHQTLGQINGTLYMSTERTRQYRNISIFFTPLILIFSYFFIAPVKYYGLGLGAIGLAIEMILIQFITQNTLLYFNCKYLNIPFMKIFFYQFGIILLLFILGLIQKLLISALFDNIYLISIFHFFIFSMTFMFLVYTFPYLIGISNKNELKALLKLK
jgi:O-antigen/teichoic acid export membrane protein